MYYKSTITQINKLINKFINILINRSRKLILLRNNKVKLGVVGGWGGALSSCWIVSGIASW